MGENVALLWMSFGCDTDAFSFVLSSKALPPVFLLIPFYINFA